MYSSRLSFLLLLGFLTLAACSDAKQKECAKPSESGNKGFFGKIGKFFKSCFGSKDKNQCENVPIEGCKGNACTKIYPYVDKSVCLWRSKPSWTSVPDFLKDFGKRNIGASTERLAVSEDEGLTVKYLAGMTGSKGGVTFYAHPGNTHPYDNVESMTLTYEVKFPQGFDLNSKGMLPGLWGNKEGVTGNVAKDEKDCGNANHKDCWSVRLTWKEGKGAAYMYAPESAGKQKYCDDEFNYCDKENKWGDMIGQNLQFKTDAWNHLAITVGTHGDNGALQVLLNEKLVISYDNINFGNARKFVGIKWESFFLKEGTESQTEEQKAHFKNFALYASTIPISI